MGECNNNDNSCDTSKNSCDSGSSKSSGECTIAEDLLCLAKEAKHELLKEKMKKILEAKIGKKLDKVAEVAVDAALACMQHQVAAREACNDYQAKLSVAFKS
ncbi:MAG: hypothetical protein AABY33_04085 [Pseudomonadota bacterium]